MDHVRTEPVDDPKNALTVHIWNGDSEFEIRYTERFHPMEMDPWNLGVTTVIRCDDKGFVAVALQCPVQKIDRHGHP